MEPVKHLTCEAKPLGMYLGHVRFLSFCPAGSSKTTLEASNALNP